MDPRAAVRVILRNSKGEILFLKRKNSKYANEKWCLPGGKINTFQKAEDACKNEIKEETNLDISEIEFLFYNDGLPIKDQTDRHFLELYFTAKFFGGVKINEESSDFKWMKIEEISKFDIAFNHDKIIKEFLILRQ
ncbi:NUDIX hydrolase [Candidatus Woesearchaeota archaeon]|nr:NUDIX hydrolase [Candidatus Woesearchaeota archaeon]